MPALQQIERRSGRSIKELSGKSGPCGRCSYRSGRRDRYPLLTRSANPAKLWSSPPARSNRVKARTVMGKYRSQLIKRLGLPCGGPDQVDCRVESLSNWLPRKLDPRFRSIEFELVDPILADHLQTYLFESLVVLRTESANPSFTISNPAFRQGDTLFLLLRVPTPWR